MKRAMEGLYETKFPLEIENIGCKGKFIYWTFKDTDTVLFNTLGMSGSWSNVPRHARVSFSTSVGEIYFNDPRNFGTLKFTNRSTLARKLRSLGPDMLSEPVTLGEFSAALRKAAGATLPEALMDQSILSGVGNYLKSDSLWLAGLSPHRRVSDLSDSETRRLYESVRSTIRTAYECGGSTILTYRGFDGAEGGHVHLVYGRRTDPNGETVINETTSDGRTTWWCPTVQK
jgi:DNA-formamidopyrimidine glycosylase